MIHVIIDFLRSLTDPEQLIRLVTTVITGWYGYATLAAIVFAETGLLVGFVLPGDSLLFTIGVVAGAGKLNLTVMIVLLTGACLLGDWCGYLLGRRAGPAIFKRPNSRFFRQEHLQRTHAFYEKHGGKTIIYAKFVPIIRTFAPFVAGIAKMRYSRFLPFDVIGAVGWVTSMTILGSLLGGIPFVRRNFEKFVLLVIFVSVLPMIFHVVKARFSKKEVPAAAGPTR
ncbi:MAG TPA: VTT domain-containing protein [Bryobacteraceae bacterium]|nr:VTT domain-containing protein [Bryobacteraceae bacterium]